MAKYKAKMAVGVAALGICVTATPSFAMSELRWKYRPVVVFAASDTDSRLRRQSDVLAAENNNLRARDMIVVTVVGDRVAAKYGPRPNVSAAALRRLYGVGANDFRAILIGKDGGVKRSSKTPISSAVLFATIDAMPMRRQEMRGSR